MRVAAAIVAKDEAPIIERCIRSVAPFVDDVVLLDTGSSDGTPDVAQRVAGECGLGFRLERAAWSGFGAAYSQLLELGRSSYAEWTLQLDADETVVAPAGATFKAPDGVSLDFSAVDAYAVCRVWAGDWEVWGPRIFSRACAWAYLGERHAYPVAPRKSRVDRTEIIEIQNHRDSAKARASSSEQRQRFLRDVEFFASDARTEHRAAYYLAQSWFDAGELELALDAYARRAQMGPESSADEYWFYAFLQIARIRRRLEHAWDWVEAAYRAAMEARPSRAEPRVELAEALLARGRSHEAFELAWAAAQNGKPQDYWLVQRSAHTWRPLVLAAQAAGHGPLSRSLYEQALECSCLPRPERVRCERGASRGLVAL